MTVRWVLFGMTASVVVVALFFNRFQAMFQTLMGQPRAASAANRHAPGPQFYRVDTMPLGESSQLSTADLMDMPGGHRAAAPLRGGLEAGGSLIEEGHGQPSIEPTGTRGTPRPRPLPSRVQDETARASISTIVQQAGEPSGWLDQPADRTQPGEAFRETDDLLSRALQQIQDTRRQLQERQTLMQELEARKQQNLALEQWTARLTQQLVQGKDRIRHLEARSAQLEGELKTDQALISSLQGRIQRLEHDKGTLTQERHALQGQLSQLNDTHREEVQRLKDEVARKEQLLTKLTQDLDESRSLTAQISGQLAQTHQELKTLQDQVKELTQSTAKLKEAEQRATQQLETARQAQAREVERLTRQVDELKQQLKQARRDDEARTLQRALSDANANVQRLTETVQAHDQTIGELKEGLAQREAQLRQAEAVIDLLEGSRRRARPSGRR